MSSTIWNEPNAPKVWFIFCGLGCEPFNINDVLIMFIFYIRLCGFQMLKEPAPIYQVTFAWAASGEWWAPTGKFQLRWRLCWQSQCTRVSVEGCTQSTIDNWQHRADLDLSSSDRNLLFSDSCLVLLLVCWFLFSEIWLILMSRLGFDISVLLMPQLHFQRHL